MGQDQDTAGPRRLDEPERGHGLAGAGGVLKPEPPVGVGILGLIRKLDILVALVLPVLWLLVLGFLLVLELGLLVLELGLLESSSSSASSSSSSASSSSRSASSDRAPSHPRWGSPPVRAGPAQRRGRSRWWPGRSPFRCAGPRRAGQSASLRARRPGGPRGRSRRPGAAPPRRAAARAPAAANTAGAIRSTAAWRRPAPRSAQRRAPGVAPSPGRGRLRASRPHRRSAHA